MSFTAKIPNGDDKVMVELTVKELMTLTGARFPDDHSIAVSARKKLNRVLETIYEKKQADQSNPYQWLG